MDQNTNRRKYLRVKAPLFYKPARYYVPKKPVVDIGLGGLRVFSDESLKTGERLEISLYLPDGQDLTFYVQVAWTNELLTTNAKFDVGLQFIDITDDALGRLSVVLDDHTRTSQREDE